MSLGFAGATVVVRRSERVNLLGREKTRVGAEKQLFLCFSLRCVEEVNVECQHFLLMYWIKDEECAGSARGEERYD